MMKNFRIRILRGQWATRPFIKSILANTLGTIIGIVLTIGTTYLVTNIEDRKSEQQQLRMLVRSLDNHTEKFSDYVLRLGECDSVCLIILANLDDLSVVPDSTLYEGIDRVLHIENSVFDYTAIHIFESSIETWRTIRSIEFIETMGKSFALCQTLKDKQDNLNAGRVSLLPLLYDAERECKTSREIVTRFFHEKEVQNFMLKQHQLYVPAFRAAVSFLQLKKDECKLLAGISEDTSQEVMSVDYIR